MELAAKSPPDGHTIVLRADRAARRQPRASIKKLPYDPLKDFEPITLLATGPYILVVHPSLPVKIGEGADRARAKRGRARSPMRLRATAAARTSRASCSNSMANVKMLHIPYKGGGPALVDLLAGRCRCFSRPMLRPSRTSRAVACGPLGVSTAKRLAGVDMPTIAEAGAARLRRRRVVCVSRARRHAARYRGEAQRRDPSRRGASRSQSVLSRAASSRSAARPKSWRSS